MISVIVNKREWILKEGGTWYSNWICSNNEKAEVRIGKSEDYFDLYCICGFNKFNYVHLSRWEFGLLWSKIQELNPEIKDINNYSAEKQCLIISDYICSLFCKWIV